MSTYKRPVLLQKQLETLLLQNYKNFEVIISDNDVDGSVKNIVDTLNDPRVKYFNNNENLGMVKSFNNSINRSTGDYIVMITDDDPVYKDMLSTLVPLTIKYPEFGVYSGVGDLIIENDFSKNTLGRNLGVNSTLLQTIEKGNLLLIAKDDFPPMYLEGLLTNVFLLWSCSIIKREVVLDIGGMPDYGSELLTDHAYIIAAGSKRGVLFTNKALGGQIVHGDNFGYDFFKIKDKYINTPNYFYNYLQNHLSASSKWEVTKVKLWNFIGRSHVEYSLMIYNSLKKEKKMKKLFFQAFTESFSNKNIHKWEYKFYLKAYFKPLFQIMLQIKKIANKFNG